MEPFNPIRFLQYQNAEVTVYYNTEYSYNDSGILTGMNDHWIELTKDNGERLLIPTYAIRLVKLIKPGMSDTEATTLLRPAQQEMRSISRE